jgi:hypothetical protein
MAPNERGETKAENQEHRADDGYECQQVFVVEVHAERNIGADWLGGELPPGELHGDGVGETEQAVADNLERSRS